VHDVVRFARSRGILCQGRGSAANSAVCYCLGITEVDPARMSMLFERFISKERNEPPDIDVDFEHERREEVIQYVYARYGRERAALAATVISYKRRAARLRDLGKALGLGEDRWRSSPGMHWWQGRAAGARLREAGFDPDPPEMQRLLRTRARAHGLSAASVAARRRLRDLRSRCGAGAGRERLDARAHRHPVGQGRSGRPRPAEGRLPRPRHADRHPPRFDLIERGIAARAASRATSRRRTRPPTHDLRAGDTVGVFQIESRAQMSMLPRLKPRCYYDLVIEVAIVRPGPIQGDMVHPYLRRRNGEEPVTYPSEAVKRCWSAPGRADLPGTGDAARDRGGRLFTPGEADQLRRAMANWKRTASWSTSSSADRRHARSAATTRFARRLFEQIKGFGELRLPRIARRQLRAAGLCLGLAQVPRAGGLHLRLLNSQPMGFYSPAQLVRDARRSRCRGAPGLTLGRHPLALLREQARRRGAAGGELLDLAPDGRRCGWRASSSRGSGRRAPAASPS
jgi:error-prone DNA polymerase